MAKHALNVFFTVTPGVALLYQCRCRDGRTNSRVWCAARRQKVGRWAYNNAVWPNTSSCAIPLVEDAHTCSRRLNAFYARKYTLCQLLVTTATTRYALYSSYSLRSASAGFCAPKVLVIFAFLVLERGRVCTPSSLTLITALIHSNNDASPATYLYITARSIDHVQAFMTTLLQLFYQVIDNEDRQTDATFWDGWQLIIIFVQLWFIIIDKNKLPPKGQPPSPRPPHGRLFME